MRLIDLRATDLRVTSLEILEQINIFRKEEGNRKELAHSDLLKIIRDEFEEEIGAGKISCTSYNDIQGKERPMFILTLSQSKQVLMRESKFVRKAMIQYIEKLENKLEEKIKVPTTFKEALLLAAKQQEEIEQLQENIEIQKQVIEEFKPQKEYLDKILASEDVMCITQIAADYGMSGVALNKTLHENGLIRKVGDQWLLYTKHMNKGYTKSETITLKRKDGTEKVKPNTKWTQKGRLKIHELLTSLGIKANMDKEKSA
ncbi:MAG: phage antirepressor KilAC domain-containing protein [Fusobacteriaceae bacterium]